MGGQTINKGEPEGPFDYGEGVMLSPVSGGSSQSADISLGSGGGGEGSVGMEAV